MFNVRAKDRRAGVTCGEVIDALAENFSRLAKQVDYDALPPRRKQQVSEAYEHNRSTAHGVPGGKLGRGLQRLDFLYKDTMFGGIVIDDALAKRLIGETLPCTFVLRCLRRYALTREEIREQEARDRAAQAASDARTERRRSTVVTVSDDNDD
jgi:hypothetical protein